jgi:hypothetical protein
MPVVVLPPFVMTVSMPVVISVATVSFTDNAAGTNDQTYQR